jgi:hypothetical protein
MDFPRLGLPPALCISTIGREAIGSRLACVVDRAVDIFTSQTWVTANKALFIPFVLNDPVTVTKLWTANGATASGNLDVGIYAPDGTLIVSTGATAQSGTSTIQAVNITDTLVGRGAFYLALSHSSTAGTYQMISMAGVFGASAPISGAMGILEMAAAHALPAAATFAAPTGVTRLPLFGLLCAPQVTI